MTRLALCGVVGALGFLAVIEPGVTQAGDPALTVTTTQTVTRTVEGRYQGWTARTWARHAAQARRDSNARGHVIRRLRRVQARTWRPTLRSAVQLASAVTGVSSSQMLRVAFCESTDNPFASNGTHWGYWQLSWSPFGLSPFDPYAAALSTAMTVKRDGGWRQWAASRPCHGLR